MEIFKLQLPISGNAPNAGTLLYNENRTVTGNLNSTQVKHYFEGAQKKVFIYGENKNGFLYLYGKAPFQDW